MSTSATRIVATSTLAASAVLLLNRFVMRNWGATQSESSGTLPGDDLIPHPLWQTTHAITIDATPEEIWPWLAQMGITRGGWYLSQKLDRVVWRIDNPSVERIVPELQQIAVGNVIPDSVDGTAHFIINAIEPNRSLVLHSRRHPVTGVWPDLESDVPGLYLDFSWAFVIQPLAGGTSRLLLRTRGMMMDGISPAPAWMRVFLPIADFADFIYTRQMLRGIRKRVNRQHHAPGASNPVPPFFGACIELSRLCNSVAGNIRTL